MKRVTNLLFASAPANNELSSFRTRFQEGLFTHFTKDFLQNPILGRIFQNPILGRTFYPFQEGFCLKPKGRGVNSGLNSMWLLLANTNTDSLVNLFKNWQRVDSQYQQKCFWSNPNKILKLVLKLSWKVFRLYCPIQLAVCRW